MLIGACWPYLDQRPAPAETWTVFGRLRPECVRIASNAHPDELAGLSRAYPRLRFVVRAKLPKVDRWGGWFTTGDRRPDLLDYREWPSEPSLRECLTRLLGLGHQVDLELCNEPDLEWDEAASWGPLERWQAAAQDAAESYARWVAQIDAAFRTERLAGRLRLAAPALSQGWEERHEAWLAVLEPLCQALDAVAVHAYTNGRAWDDPGWGGRPLGYAERFGGKPLLLTEVNDNGVAGATDPLGRGAGIGAYLAWLRERCPAVELACLFQLPGGPSRAEWWDASEALAAGLRSALEPRALVAGGAEVIEAFDVSNWQGDLTDELAQAAAEGVRLVVVRLSLESDWHRQLAVQQLRQVQGAGLAADGYLWCSWAGSPEDSVRGALALAEQAGVPIGTLWLDCEEGQPGRAVVEEWLGRAVAAAEAQGARVGIYTGAWWWQAEGGAGDSRAFARLPLWRADYDGRAELEAPGFGGWEQEAGKQYQGSPLDRSVFRVDERLALRLDGGPWAALRRERDGLITALAHLVDVVLRPLLERRCALRARRAIYGQAVAIREQFVGPQVS